MNEAQHDAVVKVESDKAAARALSTQLDLVHRRLKRSEAALRDAIRRDPASWNAISTVKEN